MSFLITNICKYLHFILWSGLYLNSLHRVTHKWIVYALTFFPNKYKINIIINILPATMFNIITRIDSKSSCCPTAYTIKVGYFSTRCFSAKPLSNCIPHHIFPLSSWHWSELKVTDCSVSLTELLMDCFVWTLTDDSHNCSALHPTDSTRYLYKYKRITIREVSSDFSVTPFFWFLAHTQIGGVSIFRQNEERAQTRRSKIHRSPFPHQCYEWKNDIWIVAK
jgi:hypothetical protein